jgi:bla regulator protein blaR1
MRHWLGRRLGRQLLLLAAGSTAAAAGQTQSPVAPPRFEVASIKPSNSPDRRAVFNARPGGQFSATNVTVKQLIQSAYGIKGLQISGGPSWVGSDLFDISAKPEGPVKPDQIQPMLQSLLAERFRLVIRRDTREMLVYALVTARNGPKLSEANESAPSIVDPGGRGSPAAGNRQPAMIIRRGLVRAQETNMYALAYQLSNFLGRTVVDKTGLTGRYDLKLEWMPDENQIAMFRTLGIPEGNGAPAADSPWPSLFTALEEQLGLRLESQKGPVEIFVIERIERPSPN